MKPDQLHRAYRELRQRAPDSDKAALIARLRKEAAADKKPRFVVWLESLRRPEWAGLGLAAALSVLMAIGGTTMYRQNRDFGPQIDEMDYDGGQAMVIEDKAEHTTLIWLAEDSDDDDDDNDTPQALTIPEKI